MKLKVEYMDTDALVPYAHNAKEHPDWQVDQIAASIEQFGMNDPVGVWTRPDGEVEIVEGHGRVLALKKLGIDKCPVIKLDHLDDDARRAYVHVHNQTNLTTGFDWAVLEDEMAALADFDWSSFGFQEVEPIDFTSGDDDSEFREEYSPKVGTVIYEPSDRSWDAGDLFIDDGSKFDEQIAKVKDDTLREMLRLRAAWFCQFKFDRIADYYVNQADEDERRVFEALGLVLLDKDGLIENGFSHIIESV